MSTFTPIPYHVHAHHARNLIEARHKKRKARLPHSHVRLLDGLNHGIPLQVKRPKVPEDKSIFPVGILGAGPGGLYTALILDSLKIPYEILEASDRTGGRLFTYHFSTEQFDYYDVGAMRFPDIPLMKRLFNLFTYPPLNTGTKPLAQQLIKYYFTTKKVPDNGFLYYNGVRERNVDGVFIPDPFKAAEVIEDTDPCPYINAGVKAITNDVYQPFVTALEHDLADNTKTGWEFMMKYDDYSTRAYMSLAYEPSPTLKIPLVHLPTDVVNWCETFDKSTGWYDRALAETILEAMAFGAGSPQPVNFYCLSGGSQVLSNYMQAYIQQRNSNAIVFQKQVTAIAPTLDGTAMNVTVSGEDTPRTYANVISTLPLTCLRAMDIRSCPLSPMQSNALRELTYGPAVKIGIKFKSPWWTEGRDQTGQLLDIIGGQSFTDRPIRTVVYPSYGIVGSTPQPTTVLIASYCWTDDAERLGALVSTGQAQYDDQLRTLVFRDLADVHNVTMDFLENQFVDIFSWDWNHNPLTMGAYAFFGPGKFEDLYDSLTVPAGNLYFAGEALSARHAWVVGALDSAWQAVNQYLQINNKGLLAEFYALWGTNPDWIKSTSTYRPGHGPVDPRDDLLLEHLVHHRPELFELSAF